MDTRLQCFNEFPDVSLVLFSGHANRNINATLKLNNCAFGGTPEGGCAHEGSVGTDFIQEKASTIGEQAQR